MTPKIIGYSLSFCGSQKLKFKNFSASSDLPPTLSFINKPAYQIKYNYLKEKYGKDLVADWPEVTDPQKFVYEDVAIAAYLLVLWDDLGIKGKAFHISVFV